VKTKNNTLVYHSHLVAETWF